MPARTAAPILVALLGVASACIAQSGPPAPVEPAADATSREGRIVSDDGNLSQSAQRRGARSPVLRQVEVPHPYYWREMYVPQAASGPTSLAWSPDGEELVYSMQGSLWRQRLDSTTAVQLTSGPRYDHQPDWSPDGRFIVYASYRDDAIELRLLELENGDDGTDERPPGERRPGEHPSDEGAPEQGPTDSPGTASRPLLADGAVNVDPRWSPDGSRLAFVSTAFEGRWHVFVAPFRDGWLGEPQRVTVDHDSGLPRYYYNRFDHYLSPTWSPDGSEIIYISNRGHIWGSGGIWRRPLDDPDGARELRYEETTWRARPDWSPGGRRVVYSSYLGRQWHQLWLMTDEGGDVFPLTYGDFDATAPRWSPDGGRIAYVSNERGGTDIVVVEIPGGASRRLEIGERRYREPAARLIVTVTEASNGDTVLAPDDVVPAPDAPVPAPADVAPTRDDGALAPGDERGAPGATVQGNSVMVPARVSVTGADGRGWVPDDAWRHADDAFNRAERDFEVAYFHTPGRSTLTVPAGPLIVEVSRGLELRPFRQEIVLAAGEERRVDATLARIDDPGARGWVSGDLHVHMNYGGTYRNDPPRLAAQAAAEDLDVVENLIVNKEQRIPDIVYFRADADPASTPATRILHGQEFHTSTWGHLGLLGLTDHYLLPDYAAYVNTAAASLYPHNAAVLRMAREQGAIGGYVHPFDSAPDPHDPEASLTNELPVDVALGLVDYLEVVGFSDHHATARVWYRLLNSGFRIAAGAGTDAMANFSSLRGPLGLNRVYVDTDGGLDHDAFLAGIRAGRTMATNGPLLELRVDGARIGDELRLDAPATVQVEGRLRSIVPVDHLEVVGNGEVVADIPLGNDPARADFRVGVPVERSGWLTLRAWSEGARHPVLDIYPFATTSPVWVTVGDQPVRSADAAAYFVAWIDRLDEYARSFTEWNDDEEREAVLRDIDRAREIFEELSR